MDKKPKYYLSEEKIDQNIDRTYSFIFNSLGCSYLDARKIFEGVLKKHRVVKGNEI